ncbi:MAG TPA: LLM class flavin-dependent oxidoreductase [Solirubrobacteraceae bacterium]|nr:LLM class flavin-dependent oxidoreductase [Solirubrobacteraceae bacterium]
MFGREGTRAGVTVPVEEGLAVRQLQDLAWATNAGGFHTVLAGEVSGPDVFALLAAIAAVAPDVRLGTGVVPTTTRSLASLAMGFATLSSLAPGRVLAGLGVSSPTVVEDWHGRPFPPPITFTREFVPAFRAALAGERVEVDSKHLRVRGFRLTLPPSEPVPLMLAAMNPRMLHLAGALGDAVQLTWCPPDEVPALVAQVREGARAAGRDPETVEIVASFFGYAGNRPELALERYRRFVLAYALQGTHRSAFLRSIPEIEEAARRWSHGDRAGALRLVGDDAVHRLCAIGRDALPERVDALHAAGVDTPVLLPAGAEPGDFEGSLASIEVLAASLRRTTKVDGR